MEPRRRYGDLEAAEDFLAIGKEVDMRDPEGRTPLFFAVAYNHAAIVEELLRAGADVHARARPCAASRQALRFRVTPRYMVCVLACIRKLHDGACCSGQGHRLAPQLARLLTRRCAAPCRPLSHLDLDWSQSVAASCGWATALNLGFST